MTTRPVDLRAAQRRVLPVLVASQVVGGVGVAAGIAVGSLLAEEVSGTTSLAGLGGTFQILGSALIAVPMAAVMARRGRRPGLLLGYALAAAGAVLLVVAGVVESFALLLAASILFGGGTAANNQARYAGADLADPGHRGRDLSFVVWATTIGSVLGPNLVGPSGGVARALGLPSLTGAYVFSLAGFVLAGAVLALLLRPDPLLLARAQVGETAPVGAAAVREGSVVDGLRTVLARPQATLGLATMVVGHTVMVSVMVMTPLHMHHGGASLELIGVVISLHVAGMFAFSPLVGFAVDRFGARTTGLVGAAVLVVAGTLAALSPVGFSGSLTAGLFLLGLGWSCTFVSGSALLTGALSAAERPGAQGGADLCMGLVAAAGGALGGVVVDHQGYAALGAGAAVLALVVPLVSVVTTRRPQR